MNRILIAIAALGLLFLGAFTSAVVFHYRAVRAEYWTNEWKRSALGSERRLRECRDTPPDPFWWPDYGKTARVSFFPEAPAICALSSVNEVPKRSSGKRLLATAHWSVAATNFTLRCWREP